VVGMAQPPAWACPDDVDLQNAAAGYVAASPKPTDWVGTAMQLSNGLQIHGGYPATSRRANDSHYPFPVPMIHCLRHAQGADSGYVGYAPIYGEQTEATLRAVADPLLELEVRPRTAGESAMKGNRDRLTQLMRALSQFYW
jgi:hypothetical protein